MMTYSILGWAEGTGALGVALQFRLSGIASLVPYGEPEVGIATQGFGHPRHEPSGLVDLEVLADLRRTHGHRPTG